MIYIIAFFSELRSGIVGHPSSNPCLLVVLATNSRQVSVPLSISLGIASAGGDPSAPLMGSLANVKKSPSVGLSLSFVVFCRFYIPSFKTGHVISSLLGERSPDDPILLFKWVEGTNSFWMRSLVYTSGTGLLPGSIINTGTSKSSGDSGAFQENYHVFLGGGRCEIWRFPSLKG